MKILALETSARTVSAAVTDHGVLFCSAYQDTGLTHSVTLMPMIENMMRTAGLDVSQMDAVAVAAGPGSFTGIRIGVAAAKGLAFGLDKPVIGVSTLAAMAHNAAFADGLIICAMDARRAQIYNALFTARNGILTRLTPDRAISLEALTQELQSGAFGNMTGEIQPDIRKTIVGDGAYLCAEYLNDHGIMCRTAPAHLIMQNAVSVALEAENMGESAFCNARDLRPVYLRPPHAVPPRSIRVQPPE